MKTCLHCPAYSKKVEIAISGGVPGPARKKKKKTCSKVDEGVDAQNSYCGTDFESRTLVVEECELYTEERDVGEGEMREVHAGEIDSFDTEDSFSKTITLPGGRRWPQAAKKEGDQVCRRFPCNVRKKCNEGPNIEVVLMMSSNGVPSRGGYVVNGQTTKASKKQGRPHPPSPLRWDY